MIMVAFILHIYEKVKNHSQGMGHKTESCTNSWNKFIYYRHCLEFSHISNFPVSSDQLLSCFLESTCVF
jgi:hypothetical protein